MDIILGFAILTGFAVFVSRTVSDWFLRALEDGPTETRENSRPSKVEILYPTRTTRHWAEARRV
ncbi:MAG: hypothetical protein FJ247_07620 [Nitrospira sp.]|nr:hypothetical protein [Nitrospira sp.]